jgi:hypothetical protein
VISPTERRLDPNPFQIKESEPMHDRTPRTVTVSTLDHGDITIPEPDWCTGFHPAGLQRIDIAHQGPENFLNLPTPRGVVPLLSFGLEQRPFTERWPGRGLFINVDLTDDWCPMQSGDLDRAAAALVDYAAKLRHAARELAVLKAGEAL